MYIKRDEDGQILAISQTAEQGMTEFINDNSVDLQQFLQKVKSHQQLTLEQSDQAMARVLEDVINLLVEQGTIEEVDAVIPLTSVAVTWTVRLVPVVV